MCLRSNFWGCAVTNLEAVDEMRKYLDTLKSEYSRISSMCEMNKGTEYGRYLLVSRSELYRDVIIPAFHDFHDFIEENSLEWYIAGCSLDIPEPACEGMVS
jgi:hypothetical protein